MRRISSRFLAAGLLSATFLLAPAHAFEPTGNATADAFLALMEVEEANVTGIASIEGSESDFTITGISLVHKQDDDKTGSIAEVVVEGGEVLSNGRLKAGRLSLNEVSLNSDNGKVAFGSFDGTDLVLPSAAEIAAGDEETLIGPSYSTIEVMDATFEDEDNKGASVGRIFLAIDEMKGDLPTASRIAVDGLMIDVSNLGKDGQKELTKLGYTSLDLGLEGNGRWDPDTGAVDLEKLALTGKDMGTLNISMKLGGVTRDIVEQLKATSDNPQQAMGLVQGVSVSNLKIRVDNDSIVDRVLDAQANEVGTDRAGLITQINSTLPLMLGVLQNPEFQNAVAAAVGTFLQNPVSLEAVAAPAAPVPVSQIMGTAMMAPQSLPQILGVSLTANN